MSGSFPARLFAPLLGIFLGASTGFLAAEPASEGKPLPLLPPLPASISPSSNNADLRSIAIRQFVYEGKIAEAIAQLAKENDLGVLTEALSALHDRREQDGAKDFLSALLQSPDPHLAASAYAAIEDSSLGTPTIFQKGFQHSDARVRVASLQAAANSPEPEKLLPAIARLCQADDPKTRDVCPPLLDFVRPTTRKPVTPPPLFSLKLRPNKIRDNSPSSR